MTLQVLPVLTCHFGEILVTVKLTLQCSDGAADRLPLPGVKASQKGFLVTASFISLKFRPVYLSEENYRSKEKRVLLFSGIFIVVYPLGVSVT